MTYKKKLNEHAAEFEENIKSLLLIYDHIMSSTANIDDFDTSKIFLSSDMKKKDLKEVFKIYKHKTYQQPKGLNNKTTYFINLIKNISSYEYIPRVSPIQLSMAYYLVYRFHNGTDQKVKEKYQGLFMISIISCVNNFSKLFGNLKNDRNIEGRDKK